MSNFFGSLSKTVHASLALAILLFLGLFYQNDGFSFDTLFWSWVARYTHVVVGTMWIGLLWYFNFVQIPNMAKIPDEQKPAIGIGMWLGIVMAFNVWFVIWPNQKRALGIVECEPDLKAKSAKTAMIFSRTNTLLSLPMLLSMVASQNLY